MGPWVGSEYGLGTLIRLILMRALTWIRIVFPKILGRGPQVLHFSEGAAYDRSLLDRTQDQVGARLMSAKAARAATTRCLAMTGRDNADNNG